MSVDPTHDGQYALDDDLSGIAPDHLDYGRIDHTKPNRLRRIGDQIGSSFLNMGAEHAGRGSRMCQCGALLEFDCYKIGDCEEPKRVLVNASFCRERLCPMCMWRHSLWLHMMLCALLAAYLNIKPQHQALLLTLTIKNVPASELKGAIDRLLKAYRKLMRYKRVAGAIDAWYRVLEITRNLDTGEFHPHLHVILLVPPTYFRRSGSLYIGQADWVALFRKALKVDYDPMCDIRAMVGVGGGAPLDEIGKKSLFEACKYVCEPGMFIDGEIADFPLRELHEAITGRRLVGMSKSLRHLSKELNQTEEMPDDFMPDRRLPDDAVYLGRETYQWQRGQTHAESRYVLVRFREWDPQPQTTEAGMSTASSA